MAIAITMTRFVLGFLLRFLVLVFLACFFVRILYTLCIAFYYIRLALALLCFALLRFALLCSAHVPRLSSHGPAATLVYDKLCSVPNLKEK